VYVNGRRVTSRSGSKLTTSMKLVRLPKGKYRVNVIVLLANGESLTMTRRYQNCAPKRRH